MSTQRFTAPITQAGSRVFIALPFDPNQVWGVKQRHYVTGTLNGFAIRALLESDGNHYFLPLGAAWRRDNKLDADATVAAVLAQEGPQTETLAADIAAALAAEPAAQAFFEALATFYRKNHIRWLESAKRPETRTARINEMIQFLRAGKKQK